MFMKRLPLTPVFFGMVFLAALTVVFLVLSTAIRSVADGPGTTHAVSMTVMEVKGSTTATSLKPPEIDPKGLSSGYGYKKPGVADKGDPGKWQVSTYLFSPSHVSVKAGDTVDLTVFVVNGNAHYVELTGPDGKKVTDAGVWKRGREYKLSFVASKTGLYVLTCVTHSPTMTATFHVTK